jgi:putative ABC transport system substrate-binding protein
MRRRDFITMLGGSATAAFPIRAHTQNAGGAKRVGVFINGDPSDPLQRTSVAGFVHAMEGLGWSVGGNLLIDYRWAHGLAVDSADLRKEAQDLVASRPDVIFTTGSILPAVIEATNKIPIVFVLRNDPTDARLVKSFASPGANATGFSENNSDELGGKWVELLKEIAPNITSVGLLFSSLDSYRASVERAAHTLGMTASSVPVHASGEIAGAIAAFSREPNGALVISPEAFAVVHRDAIIAAAAVQRLPAIYPFMFFAQGGGLMSYGIDREEQFRQAASYVDRILKGAKPNDLPVQQPMTYRLVLNLKTAQALGLTVSPMLLARADEVIE